MRYCFDFDGTLTNTPMRPDDRKPGYLEATPIPYMIDQVNRLYDEGHYIIIMTARGRASGIDWTDLTKEQLESWGIKYHELEPMFHKPNADIFIDDKGIHSEEWKKQQPIKKGIVAGVHKPKPVQTIEERKEILHAIQYVDEVVSYQEEETFLSYLKDYDIRFLGTDYLDGTYTGKDIPIDIVWLDRKKHNYSTSKLKDMIWDSTEKHLIKMAHINKERTYD